MQSQFNMRNPAVKRLMKEAQELKDATEQFHAQPLEDNLFEWHFTIRGPGDSEFDDGIYHGRIILPPEYPMKPPSIILLTPNGRFELNTKICLSISGHHPESWRPSWSIRTALLAIIGFMPTHGAGALGSLNYTTDERKVLAKKSQDWKCSQCGHIKYLLKPVTEASKETEKEAKELASQISFKGENKTKSENDKTDKKEPESSSTTTTNTTTTASSTTPVPPNFPHFNPMFNPQMMPYMFPPAGGMVYPPMFPPMIPTDANRQRLPMPQWPFYPPMMPYGFPNPFMMPPGGGFPTPPGFPGPQQTTPVSSTEQTTQLETPTTNTTITPETQTSITPETQTSITPETPTPITPESTTSQSDDTTTTTTMSTRETTSALEQPQSAPARRQSDEGLRQRHTAPQSEPIEGEAHLIDDVVFVGVDWYSFVVLIFCSLGIAILMLRRLHMVAFSDFTDWLFHPPPPRR